MDLGELNFSEFNWVEWFFAHYDFPLQAPNFVLPVSFLSSPLPMYFIPFLLVSDIFFVVFRIQAAVATSLRYYLFIFFHFYMLISHIRFPRLWHIIASH